MNIQNILNKWFSFSKYDENQTCFNLLTSEYAYHRANERVQMLIKEYDATGSLAVMYIKKIFLDSLKKQSMSLYDIFSKPESLTEYKEAWDVFTSKDVEELENNYIRMLFSVIEKAAGKKLIGEQDINEERDNIFNAIENIMDNIQKLRLDVYQYGGEIKTIKNYSTKISVFPSLAQCVSALEQADDGMYLCYIRVGDTADGYFGYFVKNNGNLFSVNERPNEAYSGQHKRSRNAHWVENKTYSIFPYNIFEFSNYDYKGYSTEHKIDESNLDFFTLGSETYFPIILVMFMLNSKYSKGIPEDKLVYIDSLLKCNFQQAISEANEENKASLIPVTNSSVAKKNQEFSINFTTEDVISGRLNDKFDYSKNKGAHYEETCTLPEQTAGSFSQRLIDSYGEGFVLDKDSLLKTDSYKLLLPENNSDEKEKDITVEFVGSKKRMELEAYRKARAQLAKHIEANMVKEYIAIGGCDGANEWWRKSILGRKEFIEKLCIKLYLENNVAEAEAPGRNKIGDSINVKGWNVDQCVKLKSDFNMTVHCYPDTRGITPTSDFYLNTCYHNNIDYKRHYVHHILCDYTGTKASIIFTFKIKDWRTIEKLLETNVPEFIKGWGDSCIYSGNPLLHATDAVASIEHPFEVIKRGWKSEYSEVHLGYSFNCDFAIAFSKRGFKKLLDKYSNK